MSKLPSVASVAAIAFLLSPSSSAFAAQEITLSEAKTLVSSVNEIAVEFKRNSTCSVEQVNPASERFCHYHMLYASCAPKKDDPGLVRNFAVNKQNGDVVPIDRREPTWIDEPSLEAVRASILDKHGITIDTVTAVRDISMEGCMYK